jgi:outer membrane protein assembly factor BamB
MQNFHARVGVLLFAILGRQACHRALGDAADYQNDPAHDGSAVVPANFNPFPTLLWSANTGGQFAYPLMAGNQIFVNDAGVLQAFNAATGHVNWRSATPGSEGFVSGNGAAYDNGQLFIVSPIGNLSYNMLSYNASTGANVWSTHLPVQYSFSSPVTAMNGSAYVGGAGSGGTLYSVSEATGTIQWSAGVENGDDSSPVVTGDGVYVSYVGPQTYKFNLTNGQEIWRYSGQVEGGGGATASFYNGNLYISDIFSYASTFNQIQALNGSNGAPSYNTISGTLFQPISPPAFFDNTGYVAYGTETEAFNASNGSVLWTRTFNDGSSSMTAPLLINGYVYEDTSAGYLYVLDGATGLVLDQLNLGSSGADLSGYGFYSGMAEANGLLAVPAGQNIVVLSVVPEPTGVLLMCAAASTLFLSRRRHRFKELTN